MGGMNLQNMLAQAKQQSGNGAAATSSATWESLQGDQYIDEAVLVDQSPIGRTPRSNPVTYIKAFDAIRDLFASLPEAKKRGFSAGHFSFNIPGGRCETCQGDGTVTVEMQFLADVELVCDDCKGTRYKPGILEVRYHGLNIHEVLQLTVKEALSFFSGTPKFGAFGAHVSIDRKTMSLPSPTARRTASASTSCCRCSFTRSCSAARTCARSSSWPRATRAESPVRRRAAVVAVVDWCRQRRYFAASRQHAANA